MTHIRFTERGEEEPIQHLFIDTVKSVWLTYRQFFAHLVFHLHKYRSRDRLFGGRSKKSHVPLASYRTLIARTGSQSHGDQNLNGEERDGYNLHSMATDRFSTKHRWCCQPTKRITSKHMDENSDSADDCQPPVAITLPVSTKFHVSPICYLRVNPRVRTYKPISSQGLKDPINVSN
ncbi:hypothetical protein PCH_Pc22g16790 [Penicillium rubens Wisconsin 54-1255]|uniref:Uncharacterized protein n=1 Tax=Penicillium rubens (strain ATCC 28089 / DSM 1075 / NRRL 1951 / Wisconsin 54-1255) TaxID=500485 RepID=B6HRY9_PENRW|nr:hypothetical protein PCH_Pc22g16790 [Penicillium rubens Wisconsin 54-1255]